VEAIVLSLCFIILVVNLVFLFFIGIFLVRMNDRFDKMFVELVEIISDSPSAVPPATTKKSQTWDEKYEREMEMLARRMRGESALDDLPTVRSYDSPEQP
jgi:hypothetical protein